MHPGTVLVCPLDWGIGHATRTVPVIRLFLEEGWRVVIAADGRPLEFLRKEFPQCKTVLFPGTKITYQRSRFLALKLIRQAPAFLLGIRKERSFLKTIIAAERPDVIFSDNRYGVYSREHTSIIMTHQLHLQLPGPVRWLVHAMNRVNRSLISRFDECWVPDFEFHNGLAGKLSHPEKTFPNLHYIGTLSRFSDGKREAVEGTFPVCDLLVMLSGPEPQRTIFEEIILKMILDAGLKAIVVRGRTEGNSRTTIGETVHVFDHLPTAELKEAIRQSHLVICRSGYSSIMDLVTLGKPAIFVPTPGQTEQEYLAAYLLEKKIFFSMQQHEFDLLYAIEMSRNFPGMVLQNDYSALKERIRKISGTKKMQDGRD